jgi:uncharacterized protein
MNNTTYAIITGASGGLGTSFALECAERGYNLLLVDLPSANPEKLGRFLQDNYPLKVSTMCADLTLPEAPALILKKVQEENMNVGLLINNAGLSQNEFFENTDSDYMRKMIEVNCISYVSMTSALLPELRKQQKSHIINVSSLGGFYTLPRKTCYSASKGFVRQYSQALNMEVNRHGVHVSVLCPGPMTTNIHNYILHRQLNWFSQKMMVHPRTVAWLTMDKALKGKEIIIPGRLNRVLHSVSSAIPSGISKMLIMNSMKQLEKKEEKAPA